MKGRLEHKLKVEESTERMTEVLPRQIREWLTVIGVSMEPTSVKEYAKRVKALWEFLGKPHSMEDLTDFQVQKFFKHLETKEIDGELVAMSSSYRKTTYSALKSFCTYGMKKGWFESNPMEFIRRPKSRDQIHRVRLTEEDCKRIVEATITKVVRSDGEERMRLRDKAIIRTFLATGIRETALTEINLSDLDMANGILTVVDKGNKTHVHKLGGAALEAMNDWLLARNEGKCVGEAVFINRSGNRISARSIQKIVKKYTTDALGQGLSPHKLRAAYATILYDKTKDIRFVQERMGHASVTTTQLYTVINNDVADKAAELMDF